MYIFPALGLGAILSKAKRVTNDMVHATAATLSVSLNAEEKEAGLLYPAIERIREVSQIVARGVIRQAQKEVCYFFFSCCHLRASLKFAQCLL